MNIVILNCFDTWGDRVDLLYRILKELGHSVKILCSDYQHVNKKRKVGVEKNYIYFSAEPYKRNISISRLHSHMQLSRDMFAFVKRHIRTIDLLWVLAPPNSFIYQAGLLKQQYPHICFIADLIDLWPETMPINLMKKNPIFNIWMEIRNNNLYYADYVITECNLYKKILKATAGDIQAETLYLAREDKGYNPCLNLPEKEIALCYLGSINNIIDINAIECIIRDCTKKQPVIFHIIGEGEKKNLLIKTAKNAGAKVIYHGKVYDRLEKQQIFDSCHYGLNIMKSSVCVGLTMKSIDYFEFGLPLINNIKGDTWDAVKTYDTGINYNGKFLDTGNYNFSRRKNARCFFEAYLTDTIFKAMISNIVLKKMNQ